MLKLFCQTNFFLQGNANSEVPNKQTYAHAVTASAIPVRPADSEQWRLNVQSKCIGKADWDRDTRKYARRENHLEIRCRGEKGRGAFTLIPVDGPLF